MTLPSMLRQENAEVIVIDYDCPDDAAAYAKRNGAWGIRIADKKYFNISHAFNIGAKKARGRMLLFVGADATIESGIMDKISSVLRDDIVGVTFNAGSGLIALKKEVFFKVKGYNEKVRGWGREDKDLETRIRMAGGSLINIDKALDHKHIEVIKHDSRLRARFSPFKDIGMSKAKNDQILTDHRNKYGYIGNIGKWGEP
jgi:glycosyltransferase involved in cell wall biosynthesis